MVALSESLNTKIILAVVLSLAMMLAASFYLLGEYQKTQLMRHMKAYSSQLNEAIRLNLEHKMLRNEVKDIYNSIRELEDQRYIERVRVLDTEGKVAFSPKQDEGDKTLETFLPMTYRQFSDMETSASPRQTVFENLKKQSILRSTYYIPNQIECQTCHAKEQKILGTLLIDTSLTGVEREMASLSGIMFFVGLVTLLSAASVIIVVLRRLVIKPIELLALGTQKLADGERDYRIQTQAKDEIGNLTNSFNMMAGKLKDSQEKLENFNEELQQEVERKTQQIKANADMLLAATQTFNELTLAALHDDTEVLFENPHLRKCWEEHSCKKTDCSAYGSDDLRCWQIAGTFCDDEVTGHFAVELGDCRKCRVFQASIGTEPIIQIGENFNNMMYHLRSQQQKLIDFSEQLQEKNRELLQRNAELATLLDIGAEFSHSVEFQRVIDKILMKTNEFFGSHSTVLFLLDEDKTQFTTFSIGWEDEEDVRDKLPAHCGVPGWVVAHGRPMLIHDTTEDSRFKQIYQKQTVRSILMVPIGVNGKIVGTLGTASLDTNCYNEEQIDFLMAIANYAAVAMENAQLFEQQKRSYSQLEEAHEQMIRTEKLAALGEMVSGIAHNFNNILAGILGYTQLLQTKVNDPQILTKLNIIEKATLSGADTVKRMRDFARKAASSEELFPLNINEIVESALKLTEASWRNAAQEKGINIDVHTDLGKVSPILGNAAELLETLSNMILNAVDAMPEGGEIMLRTFSDAKSIMITVTDTGIGMSNEIQRKIFDPFFTTKGTQGTGLGLSISHSAIQRHGGRISVDSTEGQGTTFTITLPISVDRRDTVKGEEPEVVKQEERVRILVVEDDNMVRNVVTSVLTEDRHDVTAASNGDEALEFLRISSYHIVLTDLGMPGVTGWEVARAAKNACPDTLVIMLSGYGLEMSKDELRDKCVDISLDKPIQIQRLRNIINEVISSTNNHEANAH